MPLTDLSGSTIAIVNAASRASPPATTYTYNPSGVPSVSGQASNYPFLYQGMENEFTDQQADFGQGILYYRGDGQFYSAQIARSFSLTGAQGTSGPGGAGGGVSPAAGGIAGPSGGQAGLSGASDVAASGAASIVAQNVVANVLLAALPESWAWVAGPIGEAAAVVFSILNEIFDFFGGGGPSLPPNYFVFQARLQRAKQHPLYGQINGVPTDIVLNESPAAPTLSASQGPENEPPLAKYPAPSMEKFAWFYSHVIHPLDLLAANGAAFVTGATLAVAGLGEIAATCIIPSPVEPLTCAAGAVAGGLTFGVGASAIAASGYGFAKITLPAIKEAWGLP